MGFVLSTQREFLFSGGKRGGSGDTGWMHIQEKPRRLTPPSYFPLQSFWCEKGAREGMEME